MNALKRLEDWIYEHKSHSCELSREDGYGANYWELRLYPPKIFAVEWCLDYDINKLQKVIETLKVLNFCNREIPEDVKEVLRKLARNYEVYKGQLIFYDVDEEEYLDEDFDDKEQYNYSALNKFLKDLGETEIYIWFDW